MNNKAFFAAIIVSLFILPSFAHAAVEITGVGKATQGANTQAVWFTYTSDTAFKAKVVSFIFSSHLNSKSGTVINHFVGKDLDLHSPKGYFITEPVFSDIAGEKTYDVKVAISDGTKVLAEKSSTISFLDVGSVTGGAGTPPSGTSLGDVTPNPPTTGEKYRLRIRFVDAASKGIPSTPFKVMWGDTAAACDKVAWSGTTAENTDGWAFNDNMIKGKYYKAIFASNGTNYNSSCTQVDVEYNASTGLQVSKALLVTKVAPAAPPATGGGTTTPPATGGGASSGGTTPSGTTFMLRTQFQDQSGQPITTATGKVFQGNDTNSCTMKVFEGAAG
jgi:hypothetical protein